jgi:hypothetical protein
MPAVIMLHIIGEGIIILQTVTAIFKEVARRAVKNFGEVIDNDPRRKHNKQNNPSHTLPVK